MTKHAVHRKKKMKPVDERLEKDMEPMVEMPKMKPMGKRHGKYEW